MAERNFRLRLRRSSVANQSLPTDVKLGEPVVNLSDGIVFLSGNSTTSPSFVPSDNNSGYFEVGSNLNQLKIRDKIISYSGVTNLTGKFLRGTSSGFVLDDITAITGVDNYVTGSTFTPATTNSNQSIVNLKYNSVGGTPIPDGTYTLQTQDTFTTGGTLSGGVVTFTKNDGTTFGVDLSSLDVNDTFVTGATWNSSTNILTLGRNEGQPDLNVTIDTFTGPVGINGDLTLSGGTLYADDIVVSGLGTGRVVYTDGTGGLTTEAGFEYNDVLNRLTVGDLAVNNPSGTTVTIGQGGMVIGSGGAPGGSVGLGDLTVHGNLNVYGTETVIDTTNLYVEDNNILLNYNPTGDTSSTYLGAGFTIQDGDGAGSDVVFATGQLYLNGNINSNAEYTGATGSQNLSFFTSMNDIIIRNTNNNTGAPDGKRVLAEDDCLDGGQY